MSVNISISNLNKDEKNCEYILKLLSKYKINCRTIETKSLVDYNIEDGCLLTFSEKYNSKKEVLKL